MRTKFVIAGIIAVLLLTACELEGGAIIGPGGGHVFYDKGAYSDGWRYLEAAPEVVEIDEDPHRIIPKETVGTKREIGQGKQNTKLILAAEKSSTERSAAKICDEYSLNGYDDWFIPSIDELKELPKKYFWDEKSYLSSSLGDYGYCFIHFTSEFYEGHYSSSSSSFSGGGDHKLLPVRRF
jgi:hypothetical protein